MKRTRPAYLLRRYFEQKTTKEEKAELMDWISRDKNEVEIKELMDEIWGEFQGKGVVFTNKQSEEMLQHILKNEDSSLEISSPGRKHQVLNFLKIAAAVLILVATGSYFFIFSPKENKAKDTEIVVQQEKEDVSPGGNHAVLTLSNGTAIPLDSMQSGVLAQQGNSKVMKVSNGLLSYQKQKTKSQGLKTKGQKPKIQYNTLITPRGGQYQLILPDDSKVWLNAASSIRFPTAFTGDLREVSITGEAFFEIAQDATKPFIVHTNDLNIKVLGTSFNVNVYPDEPIQKTTLVEGGIAISHSSPSEKKQGVRLKPGQVAFTEKNKDNIQLASANIEEAIAWKNGLFHFEGEKMKTIMHKLARWYDLKIVYEGNIPTGHYSGIISRNTNLSKVLEILKLSGIKFKIEDQTLTVIN